MSMKVTVSVNTKRSYNFQTVDSSIVFHEVEIDLKDDMSNDEKKEKISNSIKAMQRLGRNLVNTDAIKQLELLGATVEE